MSTLAEIVDGVVAEAGPAIALLTIEEKNLQSLGSAFVEGMASSVVAAVVGGEPSAGEGEWATVLTATDAASAVLATRRIPGMQAVACLPRAVHFARSTGRAVELRTPGRTRRFVGPSVLAAAHEPARGEADLTRALREGGWHVAVEHHGVTVMRGRAGREVGMAILMVLLVTLFLPITMIVVVAAALGARRQLRALAAQWTDPFRHVDERLRIEIRPGGLRWAIWRDGQVTLDRTLDPGRLLAVHADGPFDKAVLLVEPSATSELPCLARGEPERSFQPPQSDALADLIVRIWAKPPPGYRG